MNYFLLFLVALLLASVYSQIILTDTEEDSNGPMEMFWKRGSLSNMMRLGKRAMKKNCEDCHLGNLMRIGRR